ncbi:MAG: hypothetical protein HQK50_06155 [Oligoflexia bacterium]|nr:hypothetical protein [Oligoflexia bacterium]
MKRKQFLISSLSLASFIFSMGAFYGCSDDSAPAAAASSSSGNQVTSLAQLPGATTPVNGTYADFLRSLDTIYPDGYIEHDYAEGKAATTGQVLSAASITPFSSATAKTRGGCEAVALLKESYSLAAQPDKIKCYIGKIEANQTAAGLTSGQLKTDGTYNYFTVVENGNTAGQIKFKLTKSGGVVTNFEMFECMNTPGTQSGYISTTISGTTFAMSMKNLHSYSSGSNSGTYRGDFTVSGTLSGTSLTSKQFTSIFENSGTFSGNTNSGYGKVIVDEYASTFKINAYNHFEGTGTWGSNYFANSQNATIFGVVQLLNATPGKMSTLAAGDGSLKAILVGKNKSGTSAVTVSEANACVTNGVGNCWVQDETVSDAWTGDGNPAEITFNSSAYGYTEVNATTPSLTQSDPTITFGTSETWDCSTIATADAAAGVTMLTVTLGSTLQTELASCDTLYGFGEQGGRIECWQLDRNN